MTQSLEDELEAIRKRNAKIKAQKLQILNQISTKNKKDEIRLQILIGTGILNDLKNTIETDIEAFTDKKTSLKAILDRTIITKSNRDFLNEYDFI